MDAIPASLDALRVPVASLKHYGKNPRTGDVDLIARSLEVNGQYRPVVVNSRTSEVLAGNHTLKAARQLGWTDIAATFVDADDEQAARIALVDNRANDVATYDDSALIELLQTLEDLAGTGFSQADLDALLAEVVEIPPVLSDPDDVPTAPTEPVTVRGDVWLLGPHRILCGDCRDFSDVEKLMAGRSANVAFTSPPYASQRKYDESSGFKPINPDEYVDWFEDVQANVRSILAVDGSWFVNIKEHCIDGQRSLYVKDLTIAHVRQWSWMLVDELCWDTGGFPGLFNNRFKNGWEPVFHFASGAERVKFNPWAVAHESESAFKYDAKTHITMDDAGYSQESNPDRNAGMALPSNLVKVSSGGDGSHSAAFPVALPAWFIKAYSDTGDAIFDPFMGSGTTLVAAHIHGRVGYGLELSPAYVDVICKRFQMLAGVTPILESTGEPHDFTAD